MEEWPGCSQPGCDREVFLSRGKAPHTQVGVVLPQKARWERDSGDTDINFSALGCEPSHLCTSKDSEAQHILTGFTLHEAIFNHLSWGTRPNHQLEEPPKPRPHPQLKRKCGSIENPEFTTMLM